MTILLNLLLISAGVIALFYGSDWLVMGSSQLARRFNLSPLLVGLTIVAIGTSSPELFVNLYASVQGLDNIVLGNVLGSNIANMGLILGTLLIFMPCSLQVKNITFDMIFLILVSFLFPIFVNFPHIRYTLEGAVTRWEGGVFLLLLLGYFAFSYHLSKDYEVSSREEKRQEPLWKLLGFVVVGLILLGFGSDWLVRSARYFASEVFGVSDKVIALTLVAAGTSLPEFLTSLVALIRKELDLSIGNLLGSSIFNLLGVLGISALVRPLQVAGSFTSDFWVMMGIIAIVVIPALLTKRLGRLVGVFLLTCYVSNTVYLIYVT